MRIRDPRPRCQRDDRRRSEPRVDLARRAREHSASSGRPTRAGWPTRGRPRPATRAIFLYDTKAGKLHQVTSGYLNDTQPTFDPEGQVSVLRVGPRVRSGLRQLRQHLDLPEPDADRRRPAAQGRQVAARRAQRRGESALDTNDKDDSKKRRQEARRRRRSPTREEAGRRRSRRQQKPREERARRTPARRTKKTRRPTPPHRRTSTSISRASRRRAVVLPPKAGNYADLQSVKGKLLYRRLPRAGIERREEPDRLLRSRRARREDGARRCGRVRGDVRRQEDAGAQQEEVRGPRGQGEPEVREADGDRRTSRRRSTPRAEWRQIFNDVFRFERDFFYDPNMHGVNWTALRERYGELIEDAVTRWDVDFVIGEFIGELNASHTYHGGGDMEEVPQRSVGMLGVDWELANGAYRIKRDRARRSVGLGGQLAARRTGRQREGRRVRARGQRRPARHQDRSVGQLPGARRQDGRAHRQLVARRLTGARQVVVTCLDERNRAAIPRVDRGAPAGRRQGDQRQDRLHLRAEHRRRRAERADAPVHGAVEEGRPHHRRTLEQRRPDSRSLHRAAEPADRRVLGGARRRQRSNGRRSRTAGRRSC